MLFKEFGNPDKPVLIFLHGGGLSNWMWRPQVEAFQADYHVITPVLDGHGDAYQTTFTSISESADQVITYINDKLGGKVFAICGLSIGAQITVEILSKVGSIAQKAVIESALLVPSRIIAALTKSTLEFSFFLVKKRWFAKMQSKQMYLPDDMFEDYFRDSSKISKETMIHMMTDNACYALPEHLDQSTADALILCGAKEYAMMRESAELLQCKIKSSKLQIIPECGHGFSIKEPDHYIKLLQTHFSEQIPKEGGTHKNDNKSV